MLRFFDLRCFLRRQHHYNVSVCVDGWSSLLFVVQYSTEPTTSQFALGQYQFLRNGIGHVELWDVEFVGVASF